MVRGNEREEGFRLSGTFARRESQRSCSRRANEVWCLLVRWWRNVMAASCVTHTRISETAEGLRGQPHIRVVHANARFPSACCIVLCTPHAGSVHWASYFFARHAIWHPGKCRTVQARQHAPLRTLELRSWTEFYRVARGMTSGGLGQIEGLDAWKPAILAVSVG